MTLLDSPDGAEPRPSGSVLSELTAAGLRATDTASGARLRHGPPSLFGGHRNLSGDQPAFRADIGTPVSFLALGSSAPSPCDRELSARASPDDCFATLRSSGSDGARAAARFRIRPNAAAQVRRTAPPARRSHSSRAIVPTGPEPAIPTATLRCLVSRSAGRRVVKARSSRH